MAIRQKKQSAVILWGSIVVLVVLGASLAWAVPENLVPGFEVIYPANQSKIKFSHKIHAKHDCLTCHESVATSTKSEQRNLPAETVCAGCHAEQTRKLTNEVGDVARCEMCHRDYDPANRSRPSRVTVTPAKLIFSHQAHQQRLISCKHCHAGIDTDAGQSKRPMPNEAMCLSCHERNKKGNTCGFCHPSLPSGLITTDFNGLKLVPTKGKLNHYRNWEANHAIESRMRPESCRSCHQQHDCNACHDGVMRPMKIHPDDYATTHAIDARNNRNRCNSCHRYQSFCLDCHQKMGLTTGAERKSERTRIHPEGFDACIRTPNHHSFQAKRSLLSCVSCHTEKDCLNCHKSGSACGGGVRIHGHLSPSQLDRMKAKNPRACKKCHDEFK